MALTHPQASASLTISQAGASISELQLGVRLGPSLCAAVTRESRKSRVSQSPAAGGYRHPAPRVPPAPDSWASVVPSDERRAEGHTQLSVGSHACIYLENPRTSRYVGNRGLVYVWEEGVFLNTWVIAMGAGPAKHRATRSLASHFISVLTADSTVPWTQREPSNSQLGQNRESSVALAVNLADAAFTLISFSPVLLGLRASISPMSISYKRPPFVLNTGSEAQGNFIFITERSKHPFWLLPLTHTGN